MVRTSTLVSKRASISCRTGSRQACAQEQASGAGTGYALELGGLEVVPLLPLHVPASDGLGKLLQERYGHGELDGVEPVVVRDPRAGLLAARVYIQRRTALNEAVKVVRGDDSSLDLHLDREEDDEYVLVPLEESTADVEVCGIAQLLYDVLDPLGRDLIFLGVLHGLGEHGDELRQRCLVHNIDPRHLSD
jgi:hypothetical protein